MVSHCRNGALPIKKYEDEIVKNVKKNQVVIIVGQTGCGKSTQVSQYLYRNLQYLGFGKHDMIACLHPRSIAAVSLAEKVASEMNTALGDLVGYRIRFYSEYSRRTRIMYMTAGYMSRKLHMFGQLGMYSVVIVDEAHERSIQNDLVMGQMKELLRADKRLRLVVMSATMNVEEVVAYYPGAVTVTVGAVPDLVEVVYRPLKDTNYIEAIVGIVRQIVSDNKEGHILIFLPTEEKVHKCKEHLKEIKSCRILKFYSAMDKEKKKKVFENFGWKRKVIVSTNIAETSLTIAGVNFVIDTGLVRRVFYRHEHRLESGLIKRVSRAEADQRKGRTGRTGPGTCYRLFPEFDIAPRDGLRAALRLVPILSGRGETFLEDLLGRLEDTYSLPQLRELVAICADAGLRRYLDRDSEVGVLVAIRRLLTERGGADTKDRGESTGLEGNMAQLRRALRAVDYFTGKDKSAQEELVATMVARYSPAQIHRLSEGRIPRFRDVGTNAEFLRRLEHVLEDAGLSDFGVPHDRFSRFPPAEVTMGDLGSTVLFVKKLGFHNVSTFPFIVAPDPREVAFATKHLQDLGLLDEREELTELGTEASALPMSPPLAKVALVGARCESWRSVFAILAVLAVRFIQKKRKVNPRYEDLFHLLDIYTSGEMFGFAKWWCKAHGVLGSNIRYAHLIARQLGERLGPPYEGYESEDHDDQVRGAFLSGFFLNLAVRDNERSREALLKSQRKRGPISIFALLDGREGEIGEHSSVKPGSKIVMPLVLYGCSPLQTVSMRTCSSCSWGMLEYIKPKHYDIPPNQWKKILDNIHSKL